MREERRKTCGKSGREGFRAVERVWASAARGKPEVEFGGEGVDRGAGGVSMAVDGKPLMLLP
jgi:hypothetical protein